MKNFFKICLGFILLSTQFNFKLPDVNPLVNSIQSKRQVKDVSQVDNFKVEISKRDNINDFISTYNFYTSNDIASNLIVADALNKDNYIDGIYEFKLISNTVFYDYLNFNSLYSEKYVVEIIRTDSSTNLIKEFYIPNDNEVNKIIEKSLRINNNDSVFSNLITSINIENSYKSSLPSIVPLNTISYTEDVNNQNILDHFLSTQSIDTPELVMTSQNAYKKVVDHQIVNLIPKSKFTSVGTYTRSGTEWGFFLKTFNDYGNNMISSLLIYDINNLKFSTVDFDIVSIKTVYAMNFKYDATLNVVYKDSPNNYCIGNPQYKASIQYVNLDGNKNNFTIPNSIENDHGYCFSAYDAALIGVGKNFNQSYVDSLSNILIKAGSIALTAATQNWPLSSQIISGLAYDWITKSTISYFMQSTESNSAEHSEIDEYKAKGKYVKKYHRIFPGSNLGTMKRTNKFYKTLSLSSPYQNESEIEKSNPMLFKNDQDSINYSFNLMSEGDSSDKYTILLNHYFKLDIFNDNTWLFNQNPEFLKQIEFSWSYAYGYDINRDITITNGQEQNILFGKNGQQIEFTPKYDGVYDALLYDMPAKTTLSLESTSICSGDMKKDEPLLSDRSFPTINVIKINQYFYKNQKYIFKILGSDDTTGFAHFRMIKSSNSSLKTGTNSYGTNYISKAISNPGFAMDTELVPQSDGLYTINIISSTEAYTTDTYFELLNSDFKPVFKDDDGWGGRVAGARFNLKRNQRYYIVSRKYIESNSSEYNVSIFKQSYLPDTSQNNLFFFKEIGPNVYSEDILISFRTNRTLRFTANYGNITSGVQKNIWLNIYDANMSLLFNGGDILSRSAGYTFDLDKLYILRISVPISNTGGVSLSVENL